MSLDKLRNKAEQKQHAAGGGVWFANGIETMCFVSVTFYPKTRLVLKDIHGNTREVTKQELENNYHRLRL